MARSTGRSASARGLGEIRPEGSEQTALFEAGPAEDPEWTERQRRLMAAVNAANGRSGRRAVAFAAMRAEGFGEPELRVHLGHVYAHLNRAWHMRDAATSAALDPSDEQCEAWTQFPRDLKPVG